MGIFICLLFIYLIVLLARYFLTLEYYDKNRNELSKNDMNNLSLKEITIFQPILSGDKHLEDKLLYIYNNIEDANLIWAIDENDIEAERIINKITSDKKKINLEIKKCKLAPININPKVYKIIESIDNFKNYTVILDDDTNINIKSLKNINKSVLEKGVITGIPYYEKSKNIYANMVRAYVNSNAVYTYFSMAKLHKNNSINGMFYIFKTSEIKKLHIYENIQTKLCDDYEFAKEIKHKRLEIYQSTIPCKINTDVSDMKSFLRLMRRWHIFVNYYMKQNLNLASIIFLIYPFIFSIICYLYTFMYTYKIFLIYIGILLVNSIITKFLREKIIGEKEGVREIIFDTISNIVQIFYWILALIKPSQLIWRGKKIKVKKGEVELIR